MVASSSAGGVTSIHPPWLAASSWQLALRASLEVGRSVGLLLGFLSLSTHKPVLWRHELRRSQSTPHLVPAGVSGHIHMSAPLLLGPSGPWWT